MTTVRKITRNGKMEDYVYELFKELHETDIDQPTQENSDITPEELEMLEDMEQANDMCRRYIV